jgi:nicotinate (nicotinamide) nucleotide adenylyltransferase
MPNMKHKTIYTMVYGLSADPVHQMHVNLVVQAAKTLNKRGLHVATILIVPVYRRNPVGTMPKSKLRASFADRLAMSRLVASEIARGLGEFDTDVEVSGIEQQLAQDTENPNYTVETLQALQAAETPDRNWVLLLGSDLVSGEDPELRHWYQIEKLIQLAIIAIYPRPGYPPNADFLAELEQNGACFIQLDEVTQKPASASQIRQRLRNGDDPLILNQEGLLPEPVAKFIKERGLYFAGE